MFANQRRGTAGLGSIAAVGFIAIAWLFGTGLMMDTYRTGAASSAQPAAGTCAVVCPVAPVKGKG